VPRSEFAGRRARALDLVPDGLVLLHSRSGLKRWDEAAFHQDPNFLYFTSLENLRGGILVLDGMKRESRLFVPPLRSPASAHLVGLAAPSIGSGHEVAASLGLDRVSDWDDFTGYLDARVAS